MAIVYVLIGYLAFNTMIWLVRHLAITKAKRQAMALSSAYPLDRQASTPKVSMLVAARNESANIERCLRSLLAQNYPNLEIIAINDRSDDDTGQIIDRVAAESQGRLTAVHVQEVLAGWLGKPNAMRTGMKHATGELLCFTDADCNFICPDTIGIAVQYAREHNVDLFSVLPVLETSSFWEHVLQPVCSAVMMVWFRPERVNNPRDPRAYANGAFMLFTRECYDAIGGHESARGNVNEDMVFARLVKAKGLRLNVVQNADLYRTRMYENFRATYRGWSRIFYGCFAKLGLVIAAAAMVLLMSILPYLIFVGAAAAAAVQGSEFSTLGWWVLGLSAAAIVAQMSVLTRFYRLTGLSWTRALSYPIGAVVVVFMLISAARKFFGSSIDWRGRQIATGRSAA